MTASLQRLLWRHHHGACSADRLTRELRRELNRLATAGGELAGRRDQLRRDAEAVLVQFDVAIDEALSGINEGRPAATVAALREAAAALDRLRAAAAARETLDEVRDRWQALLAATGVASLAQPATVRIVERLLERAAELLVAAELPKVRLFLRLLSVEVDRLGTRERDVAARRQALLAWFDRTGTAAAQPAAAAEVRRLLELGYANFAESLGDDVEVRAAASSDRGGAVLQNLIETAERAAVAERAIAGWLAADTES